MYNGFISLEEFKQVADSGNVKEIENSFFQLDQNDWPAALEYLRGKGHILDQLSHELSIKAVGMS